MFLQSLPTFITDRHGRRAKELANDKNLGLGMTPEQLEARFVGRWHSGKSGGHIKL